MNIDTSHCKNGAPDDFIAAVAESNKDFNGTIYIYDNDLVDEGCKPFSITQFKVGDKVKRRYDEKQKVYEVVDITPATYGFMNVFIQDESGDVCIEYSGDIAKA